MPKLEVVTARLEDTLDVFPALLVKARLPPGCLCRGYGAHR